MTVLVNSIANDLRVMMHVCSFFRWILGKGEGSSRKGKIAGDGDSVGDKKGVG